MKFYYYQQVIEIKPNLHPLSKTYFLYKVFYTFCSIFI